MMQFVVSKLMRLLMKQCFFNNIEERRSVYDIK